jgi:hypothetical protein
VFASNRGERNLSGQLWLVRPDGGELGQLTSGDWGHVQPAWGWDSRWLSAFRFQELETVEYGGIFLIPLPES